MTPDTPVIPAVQLRSVVALLGRFPALAGFDLQVANGEVVLLQGPNGAGKTTVLRVCAGLVPVVDGDINVLGVDLRHDITAVRRRAALLGPAAGLYRDLTVRENLDFWCRAAGVPGADGSAALARMAVPPRLNDVPVQSLSTGQLRRVAFAVLLAGRAELWLLDEPHSGLDAGGRDLVDGLIRDASAAGATVILASHESARAAEVSDRTVAVAGGVAA